MATANVWWEDYQSAAHVSLTGGMSINPLFISAGAAWNWDRRVCQYHLAHWTVGFPSNARAC